MTNSPTILVTGATGKVGQQFCETLLRSPAHQAWQIRALCHNRQLPPNPRVTTVRGSIADRNVVEQAMQGVTHVVHLATCKETPKT
jgi:UDP-glucose 4-epimerase